MTIDKIYFDMDGVLADFDRFVTEHCGMTLTPEGWQPGGRAEMWRRARAVPHFYDRLEPIEGALELFRRVRGAYGERCEILTGIPEPELGLDTAADDKRSWVRRLISDSVKVNTVYRGGKTPFCKGAGSILIDDFTENTDPWTAAGGTAVLFRSAAQTLRDLEGLGVL